MDNMQDKLDAIRAKRKALDAEAARQAADLEQEKKRTILALAALAPRVRDIMKIGLAIYKADLPLGEKTPFPDESYELVSNCWSHRIGFILGRMRNPVAIGQMGGGACGMHFAIDEEGRVNPRFETQMGYGFVGEESKDFLPKAKSFLAGFDAFEKKVSSYVDSLAA